MGMGGNIKRKSNRRVLITTLAAVSWVVSMAFVGFFLPSFVDSSPLFKVKEVSIKGLRFLPEKEVSRVVGLLGSNWLFLSEEKILEVLNKKTGNSVQSIEVRRVFSARGVALEVYIKERHPIATLNLEGTVYLLDEKGNRFRNKYIDRPVYPIIHTPYFSRDVFEKLHTYVLSRIIDLKPKEVYISKDKVILYLFSRPDLKVILPPVEFLDDAVSKRLKFLYNLKEGEIDLRYSKFILVN
jgi:ABC-type multidrug transport system fused ATPase/permease subunit